MNVSTKILIFLGAVMIIGGLGFIIYKQNQIAERQKNIETQIVEQKQLQDNIIRAQAAFATKEDIDRLASDNSVNLNIIRDDLEKMGAQIDGINVLTVSSQGPHQLNVP